MFTGIVESLGEVVALSQPHADVAHLEVFTTLDLGALALGASVAVNGVCLTLTAKAEAERNERAGTCFEADLGPETLARTTLGGLTVGSRVHLERALRMGDSLGGHLVSGHVDDVGHVVRAQTLGDARELVIEVPAAQAPALAPKGSVTVDGVSLTVNWVDENRFQVVLIPHTLSVTTLGERHAGDRVNIETDLMAKHVLRVLEHHAAVRRRRPKRG
ncbi:MAG: riboflavin synthase [Myxococcales bacterium]|nr:riboflavin synthase [Myxococcales bacterium]